MKKERFVGLSVFIAVSLAVISTIIFAVSPSITLDSPAENSAQIQKDVDLICTARDDEQLINLTLYHNFSGIFGPNETIENSLFIVDVDADIRRSTNFGENWKLTKDDYNGGGTNGASSMTADGKKYVYILHNQMVWRSADKGINWINITNDFSQSDNDNGIVITADYNNNLYIVDEGENLFKSVNFGETWNKVNDSFNQGTNNSKGVTSNTTNVLFIVDGGKEVWKSVDGGVTWNKVSSDYGGGKSIKGMVSDSNGNLYVLNDQEVWESNNSGANWIKVNDDFNGGPNDEGMVIVIDANGYIYAGDERENLFMSIDFGETFRKIRGNINGPNGDLKGIASFRVPGIPLNSISYENKFNFTNLNDGTYVWNCLAYDNESLSSWNAKDYTFAIDPVKPETVLINPSNDSIWDKKEVTFECSATDNFGLSNITLYHNITGNWKDHETKPLGGTSDSTTFTINDIENHITLTWNCLTYDKAGNPGWNKDNWTLYIEYEENNNNDEIIRDRSSSRRIIPINILEIEEQEELIGEPTEEPEIEEIQVPEEIEQETLASITGATVLEQPIEPTFLRGIIDVTGKVIDNMQNLPARLNWMIVILISTIIYLIWVSRKT